MYNESSTIVLLLLSLLKTRRLNTFSGTNAKLLPRINPVSEPGTFLVSQSSSWRSPGSPRPYRRRPYTTFLLLVSHRTWVSLEHECIPNRFRGLETQLKLTRAKVVNELKRTEVVWSSHCWDIGTQMMLAVFRMSISLCPIVLHICSIFEQDP